MWRLKKSISNIELNFKQRIEFLLSSYNSFELLPVRCCFSFINVLKGKRFYFISKFKNSILNHFMVLHQGEGVLVFFDYFWVVEGPKVSKNMYPLLVSWKSRGLVVFGKFVYQPGTKNIYYESTIFWGFIPLKIH